MLRAVAIGTGGHALADEDVIQGVDQVRRGVDQRAVQVEDDDAG